MTDILQYVTLAIALGGLALSLANHRYQIRASSTRLRVMPGLAFPGSADELVRVTYLTPDVEEAMGRPKTHASIEAKNLGEKPVRILEMGFLDRTGKHVPWRSFPLVLEPEEIGAAYLRIHLGEQDSIHAAAYALTDCGERFEGGSPVMDDLALRRNRDGADNG